MIPARSSTHSLSRFAGWSACCLFLSEVFASLIVNPSLVITTFVHANASAARPRLRLTKSSAWRRPERGTFRRIRSNANASGTGACRCWPAVDLRRRLAACRVFPLPPLMRRVPSASRSSIGALKHSPNKTMTRAKDCIRGLAGQRHKANFATTLRLPSSAMRLSGQRGKGQCASSDLGLSY
jgi:hypothetical protein